MSKDKIYLMDQAPEDTGEDFEAAAFTVLLEDMAGETRFPRGNAGYPGGDCGG